MTTEAEARQQVATWQASALAWVAREAEPLAAAFSVSVTGGWVTVMCWDSPAADLLASRYGLERVPSLSTRRRSFSGRPDGVEVALEVETR